ncbi:MAG: hypothetical protein GF411_13665 [Candidatus Lokiarchaeota archaeon]|nr:hypothetical protein [Candidatus Lokiarchaeota archaeon]
MSIVREYFSRFITQRRKLRSEIQDNQVLDSILHYATTSVLVMNTVLILYVSISIALKMTIAGLAILDSIPIIFYILPLLVILPSLTYSYYTSRSAAINFIIILISSIFFYLLSALVRGFIICLILNIFALGVLFVLGRFRPEGKITDVGKKGIALFVIFNLLGLAFPISVSLMGENPIAFIQNQEATIEIEVPLDNSTYIEPTSTLIDDIQLSGFGLNLLIDENDETSWTHLSDWMNATNSTEISVSVLMKTNRSSLDGYSNATITNMELQRSIYQRYMSGLERIENLISTMNYSLHDLTLRFDMTFSNAEWIQFMQYIQGVDLVGFTSMLRKGLDLINVTEISEMETALLEAVDQNMMKTGFMLESFVLDDLIDHDTLLTPLCGVTIRSLLENNHLDNIYDIRRSRFSEGMNGDVGEYAAHSYSRSAGLYESGVRLGDIGHEVYSDSRTIQNDIVIIAGNGASTISISSLPQLLNHESFPLLGLIIDISGVDVTYTFRVFAFRAVFIAIDSFDLLLF